MTTPDVSVVIVSHNSRAYIDQCLEWTRPAEREVVLVDNASSDGTVELVRERYPEVRILEARKNIGFGPANNQGVRATTSKYVLLQNPDAWPVGNAIDDLARYVEEHPDIAIAGPKLLNPNGTLQRSINGRPTALWRGKPAIPSAASPRKKRRLTKLAFYVRWTGRRRRAADRLILTRQFLKGAVLLVRRDAFDAVGGFDPEFFLFGEEIDLCERLRSARWAIEYVPHVSFVHVGASSTELDWTNTYREQLRSHLRLLAKHGSHAQAAFAKRFLVLALHARAIRRGRDGKPFVDAARWLASNDLQTLLARAGDGSVDLSSG